MLAPLRLAVLVVFCLAIFCLAVCSTAFAASVNLAWNPNPEPDIAGYRVFYGTAPRTYTSAIDVGNATAATVSNLSGGIVYYFAVTAYNAALMEGTFSNEVTYVVPTPISTPLPDSSPIITITGKRPAPQPSVPGFCRRIHKAIFACRSCR